MARPSPTLSRLFEETRFGERGHFFEIVMQGANSFQGDSSICGRPAVPNWNNPLKIPAAFHGFQHGDFVGIFQVCTHGDAHANACYANAQRLEQL